MIGCKLGLGISHRALLSGYEAPVAAPLPTPDPNNAMFFGGNGGNTRYGGSDVGLPNGDWTIGFKMKAPTTGSQSGFIYSANVSGGTNNANSFYIHYHKENGYLTASGRDSSGNFFGQSSSGHATVNARGLRSRLHIPRDKTAYAFIQRDNGVSKMFISFDGHLPEKVAECKRTFGSVTTNGLRLGSDISGSVHYKGYLQNFFKVSRALSLDEMQQVVNGVDPTSFATPAANDFRFLLHAATNPLASTINAITYNVGQSNSTFQSGVGYAPQTEPVYLTSYGWGKVFQFDESDGCAEIPLSGRYLGTSGCDIQAQVLDESNVAIMGWSTVSSNIAGNVWSGTIRIPKGPRFCKMQLRKVISGVPSADVMTTSVVFAPGITIDIKGQSSAQKFGETANPYGSSIITPNGLVSTLVNQSSAVSRAGVFQIAITGVSNNGGRCQVQVGTDGHGLYVGQDICHSGVGGTVELNAVPTKVYEVVDHRNYVVDIPFVNTWTSGGQLYDFHPLHKIFDEGAGDVVPDGLVIIGNYVSEKVGCPVEIYDSAVGGANIEQFNQWDNGSGTGVNIYGITSLLAGYAMGRVGVTLLRHGHANIGQEQYYSGLDGVTPGGVEGAYTGFGAIGMLVNFYRTYYPNSSDMKLGMVMFSSISGRAGTNASVTERFRNGIDDCIKRMRLAGDLNVFNAGWIHDQQAQWENGTAQNSHMPPHRYRIQAVRMAHNVAFAYGAVTNDNIGPKLLNGTRAGAVLTLPVQHNGGTMIKVNTPGARPSGFECSLTSNFSSLLTINDIYISGNNVVIVLSSDPGAPVYVRYMWGQPGNYANNAYITFRITNVLNNGADIVRLKCEISPTPALTPVSSQPASGLTPFHGLWGLIEGPKITGINIDGVHQLNVIDGETVDLVGVSAVGLGTFTANENAWQTSATGLIGIEMAVPIYDDREFGLDTGGAPMLPTNTPVLAA